MRLFAAFLCAVLCSALPAVTFTVTSTADAGAGTLRDAITQAEATAGADEIVIGTAINLPATITLQSALPDITEDLTITGPASNDLFVERDTTAVDFRIFTIISGTVSISNLWLGNGSATSTGAAEGGCILNSGTLTITDCVIHDCTARGGDGTAASGGQGRGGAISNTGTLTLNGVAIVDCTATGGDTNDPGEIAGNALGGGVHSTGPLTLLKTLIEGCTAQGGENTALAGTFAPAFGGGVQSQGATIIRDSDITGCSTLSDGVSDGGAGIHASAGTLDMRRSSVRGCTGAAVRVEVAATIENCTVAGNQGLNVGGVRLLFGAAKTLSYCTIHLNDGADCGGVESSGADVLGCIIAGNTGANPDVQGTFTDNGFNLIGDTTGSASFTTSTLVGDSLNPINPGLGAIQDLGDTWGHIPAIGSFAVDQGGGAAPINDQRGANRLFGAPPDIGAVEFIPNQAPSFSNSGAVTVNSDGSFVTIDAWATNISPGAPWEGGQNLTFAIVGGSGYFSTQPAIDPETGDLTFRPRKGYEVTLVLDVYLTDDGGTAGGGSDTSAPQFLVIHLNGDADDFDDDDFDCSTGTGGGPTMLVLLAALLALAFRLRSGRVPARIRVSGYGRQKGSR